jgi:branched-chain amino acid aminotransferase
MERDFDLVAMTTNLADWGDSVRLAVARNGRFAASPYARTKVLSWAFNLNWYQEAHERGFDEVVLLNEQQEVAECTSANIFAVFGGEVVTPPLGSGCLPGITRDVLLHDIRLPGITMRNGVSRWPTWKPPTRSSLRRALGICCRWRRSKALIVHRSGQTCRRLKQAFRAFIDEYCAVQRDTMMPCVYGVIQCSRHE